MVTDGKEKGHKVTDGEEKGHKVTDSKEKEQGYLTVRRRDARCPTSGG